MYTARLKTRRQFERIRDAEGYVDAYGWWVDVCPGSTLQLRDATAEDLARCQLRDNASRNPQDWLCETFKGGSLVARSAIAVLTPNPTRARHADPEDPMNSADHHTGKPCIERGCSRPAGTAWSPFWCQPCNSARLQRISGVIEYELARMKGKVPEASMPPGA